MRNFRSIPRWGAPAWLLAVAGVVTAAEQPALRADLLPVHARRNAPGFALPDSLGKIAKLTEYRGKVILLNFWATWCTGCKKEIPWFADFQRKYGRQGLSVVGVSMDEDGWKVVRPFLTQVEAPYRMLLGDTSTAGQYEISVLPATFLIDRHGKVAASYRAGVVDRANIEANIRTLLSQRKR